MKRLWALSLLTIPVQHVLAATTLGNLEDTDVVTIQSLEGLFKNAVGAVMAFAGVGFFLMLVVGGYSFMFTGGDAKKLEQARGTITNAVIGLVLIISAYLIMRIIEVFTGVTVTKFTIPGQ